MTDENLCCYFCGKKKEDVRKLIAAGNPAYCAICDECVELCVEIIREEDLAAAERALLNRRVQGRPGRVMEHVRR